MSDLVTYCRKHDVAVYPDAGKKYLAEFHERHKDCCQALVATVINNNMPGTQHIIELPDNSTLEVGAKYRLELEASDE